MPSHQVISQTSKEAALNILHDDFQEELALGKAPKLSAGSDGDRGP